MGAFRAVLRPLISKRTKLIGLPPGGACSATVRSPPGHAALPAGAPPHTQHQSLLHPANARFTRMISPAKCQSHRFTCDFDPAPQKPKTRTKARARGSQTTAVAEVLGQYSRLAHLGRALHRLRQQLAANPSRDAESVWMGQSLKQRLGPGALAELERDYLAGVGCTRLAERYGISENGVLSHLRRVGIELRPPGKLTEGDVLLARDLRADGWTYSAIAEQLGVTRTAIKWRLDRILH